MSAVARFMVRHPRLVLGAWLVILVAALFVGANRAITSASRA